MAAGEPLDLDEWLSRLREVLDEEPSEDRPGWEPVECAEPGVSLARKSASLRSSGVGEDGEAVEDQPFLLRVQYELPIPFEEFDLLLRPHNWFHPVARPKFDENILKCSVEQYITPGDADVEVSFRFTPLMQKRVAMQGTADYSAMQGTEDYRARMTVRRHFGGSDRRFACSFVPYNPDGELVEEWGMIMAYLSTLEPSPMDPKKVLWTEVKQLTRVPLWALPLKVKGGYLRKHEWIFQFMADPLWPLAAENPQGHVALSLRKCARGPPLLPRVGSAMCRVAQGNSEAAMAAFTELSKEKTWKKVCGADDPLDAFDLSQEWEVAEIEDFTVTAYLRIFLERLGLEPGLLHSTLDGQEVVPYQTVVAKSDWKRLWARLEEPFRIQQSVYRKLFGGTSAPKLSVGSPFRFMADRPLSETAMARGVPSDRKVLSEASSEPKTGIGKMRFQVVNTFVSVEPLSRTRRRSAGGRARCPSEEAIAVQG